MKVGQMYSVISMIFASNFNEPLTAQNYEKIKTSSDWIIQNECENNKKGRKLYADFLQNESLAEIRTDFRSIKYLFNASYYFASAKDDLAKFYAQINFSPKLGESDSISNQLLLIASILKNELDESHAKLLKSFLISFFLPYAATLAIELSTSAKSSFYRSLGYFLSEYCDNLQEIFAIKRKAE
ncbi:hypothetical protein LMG7974_00546 [Campylobacter majalis]|uniref:Uncharacterized protein n=1 Tax=Campylobacter majalis TaxID=2790656 RepID=A0ABM8Q464_9BACT|nr:hypothetical protein [Campylobacter majalis]CAD7287666.1 hypothetical protein LMG7974_00546 [Campylobacter majalis]